MSEEQAEYGEREFKNLLEVSEHLEKEGWKVSRSTLYKHAKDGRLHPDANGVFPAKAVEKYAIQWLHRKSDSEKVRAEKLAEEERREKIKYQAALRKQMELKLAILEGKYIQKDQLYLELAARAAVLDTGIKALVQLRADHWLATAQGNQGAIAEFMRALLADFDDLVNSFSTTKQFQVMFRNDNRPPTDDGREEKGKSRQDLQD
jgi:hypothetical protein